MCGTSTTLASPDEAMAEQGLLTAAGVIIGKSLDERLLRYGYVFAPSFDAPNVG